MKKTKLVSLVLILVLSTILLTACEKEDKVSLNSKEKIENLQLPKEKENLIYMDLYFDASKGENVDKIAKEERIINKEDLLGQAIMQEIIKGPAVKSELQPILPKETRLVSFAINDGIAIVNLSKEAKVSMSKEKESASLKGISKALSQLPSVTKVQILIDSENIDTLGGNYDISTPFSEKDVDSRLK